VGAVNETESGCVSVIPSGGAAFSELNSSNAAVKSGTLTKASYPMEGNSIFSDGVGAVSGSELIIPM